MDFDRDLGLFDHIRTQLETFIARERQVASLAEERAQRVSRGKEQLRVAKREVALAISSRLEGRENVPEVVRFLLEEAWKDVLLLTYLRQGSDSRTWTDAVAVIDELLWSVEERSDLAERQELLQRIPRLLADLRMGLTGISLEQNKMSKIFKDLQAVHIRCLRGTSEKGAPVESPRPATAGVRRSDIAAMERAINGEPGDLETAGNQTTGGDKVERDRFFNLASEMAIGSWLEIIEENGTRTRAKLSWKSPNGDVFVFVNRKGMKAAELNPHSLAGLFRRGRAEVLEVPQMPVVERALALMMAKLREDDEGAKPRTHH